MIMPANRPHHNRPTDIIPHLGSLCPGIGKFALIDAVSGHPVFFQTVEEGFVSEAQKPRRSRPVASSPFKRLPQQTRLHLLPADPFRWETEGTARAAAPPAQIDREILLADPPILGEEDQPFDNVGQLANVPRPAVLDHDAEDRRRQRSNIDPVADRRLLEEVRRKERYIFGSLPQRWQLDGNHIEAVKEVFPKAASGDHRQQILI